MSETVGDFLLERLGGWGMKRIYGYPATASTASRPAGDRQVTWEQRAMEGDQKLFPGRPAVLEVATDPTVPPLPPHITGKQAKAYLEALIKGDPDAIELVKASAKQTWASVRA